MKRSLLLSVLVGGILACVATAEDSVSDAKAIRQAAADFAEAFNRHDAQAVASHWAANGEYVNEDGQRFQGREAIQTEYETLFGQHPDVKIRVASDSVRLINAHTAIEAGRAALVPQPPGETRVMSHYTAVHVKQDGKWVMADVRDTRIELPPDTGRLEDLAWLIGSWRAESKGAKADVTYRWIADKHFIARTFSSAQSGKPTSSGLEVIGVNPLTGQITSWSFASDGGHAIGNWAPHESGWIVDSAGVMADGTETNATYILSRADDGTLLQKSGNRIVGETHLPDTTEVELKRK